MSRDSMCMCMCSLNLRAEEVGGCFYLCLQGGNRQVIFWRKKTKWVGGAELLRTYARMAGEYLMEASDLQLCELRSEVEVTLRVWFSTYWCRAISLTPKCPWSLSSWYHRKDLELLEIFCHFHSRSQSWETLGINVISFQKEIWDIYRFKLLESIPERRTPTNASFIGPIRILLYLLLVEDPWHKQAWQP